MYKIVGRYELKVVLGLTSACFAKRYSIKIAGRRVAMTLPQIAISGDQPVVIPPRVPNLPPHQGAGMVFYGGASSDKWSYGSVSSWDATTGKPKGGWLEAVALEFRVPAGSFDMAESARTIGVPMHGSIGEFFNAVDGWFQRLNDWVAVASDQDTYYAEPLLNVSTQGAGLTIVAVDGDGNVSSPAGAVRHTIWERESSALTLEKFRNVIKQVNAESDPSEAHVLLRDAYNALRRGHNRRAAIDAGAAAEIVVAHWNRTQNMNANRRVDTQRLGGL